MGKFVMKKTKNGFKFDLLATNGQLIATSRMFTTEASCIKGIESVKRNRRSDIEDLTMTEAEGEHISNPKFQISKDNKGQYWFVLNAMNGDVIVTSQSYSSKTSCKNGIASLERNAAELNIEKTYKS